MKDEALKYLHAGFSVIPLGNITKDETGSKKIEYPISWQKFQKELPTYEEILSWIKYPNLGIATGRVSNLLVLDVDSYKPGFDADLVKSFNLPVTPVQETANGGKQYFFRYPMEIDIHNAVCIGHNGSGIDIRGDGGMVIVPPTKTSYGAYSWLIDPFETPLADVPPKLLELLSKDHSSESGKKQSIVDLTALSKGEGRDNSLTKICGTLAYSLHPNRWATEIYPTMMAINSTYKPPLPHKDLKRIYESITNKELRRRQNSGNVLAETQPKQEKIFTPAISLDELMDKEFPEAQFVVNPYFETGTLNMVSAPPNTWKSWLLFYFINYIAKGMNIFDTFQTEKSRIMVVNEEDNARLIKERLKMLGTERGLPVFFHIMEGLKITKETVELFKKEILEKEIKVIIFDSLRAVHDANENDSQEMQKVMDLFKEIARVGVTVIFTHHNRKRNVGEKNNDNAEMSRGSTAINAAISGHLSLEEEDRDGYKFLIVRHLKSKAGPKHDPIELEIVNEEEDKLDFVFKGKFKEKENKARQVKESIYNVLYGGGWMTIKELREMKIGSESNIREGMEMLRKENLIKIITRKEAEDKNLIPLGGGKANEKLYSFNKESGKVDELDEFTGDNK